MALGALDIIIAADTAQLRKGMDTAVSIMQSSTQKMESFAKTAGASIASYFALSNLQSSIKASLDLADSLGKMSQKIGVSVDALYAMQAAGKLADVDMQTLEKSLLKFNKGLGTASMGSGDTANALKNLGISLKDSSGHLKDSDKYLFEVADKFKAMPNGIEKSTLAMQLFGKSGADMIPLLNGGSEALTEFSGIMNSETAASAEKFNDSLTTVGLAVDAVWMQMTSALSPTLSAIADDFVNVAKEGKGTGKTLGDDLAQGMKVAINLGYIVAGAFDMAGHALGNLGAAAVMFAEGDFDGAKYAWDRIAKDADADQKRWDARIKKVMSATAESQKDSDNQRARAAQDLEDFKAQEAEKLANAKKSAAERLKLQKEKESAAKKAAKEIADLEKKIFDEAISDGIKRFQDDMASRKKYKDEIFQLTATDYEKTMKVIDDKEQAFREAGRTEVEIAKLTSLLKYDILEQEYQKVMEQFKDLDDKTKVRNEGQITAQIDYYTAIGDESSAYYLQEEQKMKKLAETGWYTNEQMLAIKTKDNQKFQDEQWKKDNAFWVDLFENINKAMESQFFDAMTGKFNSFGDWLKDFWGSITQSMTRGLSKSLADTMTGTLYKNGADGSISGLIPSLSRGLLGTAALGSVQAMAGSKVVDGITTTAGGTILDAAGHVTKSGTDISDVTSALSTASSAYTLATAGLSSMVANGFAQGAAYTYNGLTAMGVSSGTAGSIAGGIGNFGAGMATPWASAGSGGAAGAGAMLGGAAIGAAGGYAVGKIGDKLLGADTKASSYGAIGGAIGSLAGPVGTVAGIVIGSLIGGAFGSTKVQQSGLHFATQTGGDDASISLVQSWVEMRKKSWFSSREWDEYSNLSSSQRDAIEGIFDTYDYLLAQLGSVDKLTIEAGNYTQAQFENKLTKSFLSSFLGSSNDAVFNAWTEYAKSVNKTTLQAITDSVNTFIDSTRTFDIWSLNRSGKGSEALGMQAQFAQQDFKNLADMIGASGVTVDNFTAKYQEAIKTSLSADTIAKWDSLGKALMGATDANDKFKESMVSFINSTVGQENDGIAKLLADSTVELLQLTQKQISVLQSVKSGILDLARYQKDLYLSSELSPLSVLDQFNLYNSEILKTQKDALSAYEANDFEAFNAKLGDLKDLSKGYLTITKDMSVNSEEYARNFSFIQEVLGNFTSVDFQDPIVTRIVELQAINEKYGGIVEAGFLDVDARMQELISAIYNLNQEAAKTTVQKANGATEQWVDTGKGYSTWTSTGGAVAYQQSGSDSFGIKTTQGNVITNTEAINFVNNSLNAGDANAVYQAAKDTGISASSLDALMGWSAGTSNQWAVDNNKPSFAVGSSRIPYDMEANIHKDEIIIDAKSSDVLRKYGIPSYPILPKINTTSNADQGVIAQTLADVKGAVVNMVAEIIRLKQEFTRVNEDGTALNVRIVV